VEAVFQMWWRSAQNWSHILVNKLSELILHYVQCHALHWTDYQLIIIINQ